MSYRQHSDRYNQAQGCAVGKKLGTESESQGYAVRGSWEDILGDGKRLNEIRRQGFRKHRCFPAFSFGCRLTSLLINGVVA